MNLILTKILATALALSQVTTDPKSVKTRFDPVMDEIAVVEILRGGCAHLRKAFDIEAINLDDLIATAMDDPLALTSDIPVFRGINFADLHIAYRQFCRNETIAGSPIDIGQVIGFYNRTLADLPDAAGMKDLKLPGTSVVFDRKGERFTELYRPGHRRVWVPIGDIPEAVQKAFIAAEDKRFHEHHGVDERGLVRAFVANILDPKRPQGGSTITQQVAKNVLVGSDVTYERKIREVVIAARLEQTLSKTEILELYLNSIYLGRGAWGVEMAARSYFGKTARELTPAEGALLASMAKGPAYFNPDRHPERSRERYAYVLNRMKEDGYLSAEGMQQSLEAIPERAPDERRRRDTGFHFVDNLAREARTAANIASLTADSYSVRSTLHSGLQRATEAALQEGLALYEIRTGRVRFEGAEANLSEAIARLEAERKDAAAPAWQEALAGARLPLYDVHWTPAVVLPAQSDRGKGGLSVGLADGRVMPLTALTPATRRILKTHDVVYVRVKEGKKGAARAEMRVRPQVQGAAVVLENKTGRVLAMAGAFSYPLSQLNRVTQTQRQPGSAFKPFTYLAALHKGLQPNTLIEDEPITLPPVGGTTGIMTPEYYRDYDKHYWSPKNADGGSLGIITLRRALERSRNLATARLLDGGIDGNPQRSLSQVCALAVEAKLYQECVPHYPFVLGAQPVRLIDLAAFYAAIANEGAYHSPHAIESIEQNGGTVYRHAAEPFWLASGDRAAAYQLKTMLQGVLQRGTATSIRHLARYVGGKTGTTDDGNDAWFVGFTNEVTVAVWVGYDNGDGKRRTLGGSQTGAKVAIPIFEPIVEAAWSLGMPKTALTGPSPEARRNLVALPVDLASGDVLPERTPGAFTEYFRRDASGRYDEMQYRIVSRYAVESYRDQGYNDFYERGPYGTRYYGDEIRPPGRYDYYGPYGRNLPPPQQVEPPRNRNFLEELFGLNRPRQPTYQDPRYQEPRYQDPRYRDPRYQDPRYPDSRYADPRRDPYRYYRR